MQEEITDSTLAQVALEFHLAAMRMIAENPEMTLRHGGDPFQIVDPEGRTLNVNGCIAMMFKCAQERILSKDGLKGLYNPLTVSEAVVLCPDISLPLLEQLAAFDRHAAPDNALKSCVTKNPSGASERFRQKGFSALAVIFAP